MDNLLAPLIKQPLVYEEIAALKRGYTENNPERLQAYMDQHLEMLSEGFHCNKYEELAEAPGLDAKEWRIFKVTRRIEPKNSFPFNGQVYLLINESSFSCAENLATTMKRTGLAKIVGVNGPGGAAFFLASTFFALPESGITFRMEIELALNPDGTINEIFGTQPDVWLTAQPPAKSYQNNKLLEDPWIQWVLKDEPKNK